ncbi:MAG: hypothetical protein QOD02_4515 [Mycobacterium sp.]|jgi:uncharacterized protein YbjT (DUF2867 family)|nr:hypothetical protein [Mycobacterium sp.]MDT5140770.1 hypothetical protein [Mycobacterium sp.]MDT5171174.1 hypothetical protein [Mycobacterium sp.]MDT5340894.1 hypothetical protein [Mycobacterium sp.]
MSETPILVTGAAGGQRGSTGFNTGSEGSTGNVVARLLLERGLPVRAFVHRIDERSDELSALGAEVVHGDLLDIASVRRAVVGVRRAYFVYPVQAGLLEATTTFAVAAEDAGLEIVVNNDHLVTAEDSALRHTRHHWLAEQILNHSGVGATHLRGAPFFENLWAATGQSVLADGKIYLPSGSGQRPIPLVAGVDVASAAAAILADPGPHVGKAYPLVGAMLSLREVASEFSAALNRRVEYVEIEFEQFREALAQQMPDNPTAVTHLSMMWGHVLWDTRDQEVKRAGDQAGGIDETLEVLPRIIGAPPHTLESFVRERAGKDTGSLIPPPAGAQR